MSTSIGRSHIRFGAAEHGNGEATFFVNIRRHGGRVRAEGDVGKGATFYFTLPTQATGTRAGS